MSELKPLPKKITKEIRSILEGCKSGKLQHYQSSYHCGTAHCIAGWKAVRDYANFSKDKSILTASFSLFTASGGRLSSRLERFMKAADEWEYARSRWRLTKREAERLFGVGADFPGQFALLKELERGERTA